MFDFIAGIVSEWGEDEEVDKLKLDKRCLKWHVIHARHQPINYMYTGGDDRTLDSSSKDTISDDRIEIIEQVLLGGIFVGLTFGLSFMRDDREEQDIYPSGRQAGSAFWWLVA